MLIMSELWADCCSDAVPVSSNPIPRLCGAAAPCLVAAVARAACSQTAAAATAPAGPHQGRGSFTPSNPSLAGVRGCVGEHGGGVSCVRSRFICVVVCLCVCRVPSVYLEICGQSSAAVTILLCCIQAAGGRVPRRARKGLAPCRATAEPPRRAGGSSRAAAAGPSGATTYLQSEPSPTQRILNTTHSKFQILPITLIW